MVLSRAPSAIPNACAAIPIRPPSRVCMAILKPWPSLPSMFSLGTRQSVKISSYVEDPRIPIFFSLVPKVKPGVPFSTMKEVISLIFLPLFSMVPVTAKMTYTSASLPLVMKILEPLMI